MTPNDIMRDVRLARLRELEKETAALKAELARERAARESLASHFSLALAAARDAERMPSGARLEIVDGWNVVIGTRRLSAQARRARRSRLVAAMRERVEADSGLYAWIVFDGPATDAVSEADGRLRVGYTGGEGANRADRMVCDYLRMMKVVGLHFPVTVVTDDVDFTKKTAALGAAVKGTDALNAKTAAN